MAVVWIPSLLRPLTGGQRQVTVPGATLGEVLAALDAAHPGVRERLVKGEQLQPSIAVAIDGVTASEGLLSPVGPDSELHIIPAIGGGATLPNRASRALPRGEGLLGGRAAPSMRRDRCEPAPRVGKVPPRPTLIAPLPRGEGAGG